MRFTNLKLSANIGHLSFSHYTNYAWRCDYLLGCKIRIIHMKICHLSRIIYLRSHFVSSGCAVCHVEGPYNYDEAEVDNYPVTETNILQKPFKNI
jgi:hypothetical protein